jgi:hypothetical protein
MTATAISPRKTVVRAVEHDTREERARYSFQSWDEWTVDRAIDACGAIATIIGIEIDVEIATQDEDGNVVGWERIGIRCEP